MIVGSRFEGDDDAAAMALQHDVYREAIGIVGFRCQAFYLAAAQLILPTAELVAALRPLDGFDHRVLQRAHDHLAAFWRWRAGATHPVLPGLRDDATTQHAWLNWLRAEVDDWRDHQPEIVRTVCVVLAHANTEPGYAAEDRLCDTIGRLYRLPNAERAD